MRIALCGFPRSGKDTVASIIRELHLSSTNDTMDRLAFGDYMKEGYYDENPHKAYMPKDREHMISWSQPKVEKDNLIWVRKLERDLRDIVQHDGIFDFVITDLRQPHEEKWCRENGFHIVRVHRSEEERRKSQLEKGENPDNTDLPYKVNADFHIYNDGNLYDLQKSCNKLLTILESYDKINSVTNEVNKTYAKNSNYFN